MGLFISAMQLLSLLSYTPLLTNPKTVDYAVGIKGLSVGANSVVAMSPFEGIRLKGMKGVPKMRSVLPFTTCYKASAIGFRRLPRIDLEFEGGKNWTIFGANSMKRVGGDTACLAFLDGREKAALKIVI
ncbi:hypothetical protein SASPL_112315 [Salvia splendens]|uniref:Xylanase inhibitor C-terminal domain-containing protein n=1 Tax=Salvia splendens TaxID=180675 RepID=A0A8X9A557_SALSN|nr:hypothetical protein SASPL_112315 [Salvia splendens]